MSPGCRHFAAPRPAIANRLEVLSGLGSTLFVWNEQVLNAVISALLTVLVAVPRFEAFAGGEEGDTQAGDRVGPGPADGGVQNEPQ